MPKFVFTEHLHEGYSRSEFRDEFARQTGYHLTDDELEMIGRPFYEVSLQCVVDTDTGSVIIDKVNNTLVDTPIRL